MALSLIINGKEAALKSNHPKTAVLRRPGCWCTFAVKKNNQSENSFFHNGVVADNFLQQKTAAESRLKFGV